MKKSLPVLLIALVFTIGGLVGLACAATELLPEGAVVSATVDKIKAEAHVSIKGVVPIDVEFYSHKGVKHLGAVTNFDINLHEGRHFNFVFGDDTYVLLTPRMATTPYPPEFFGPGIGMDCSGPDGCCFLITGD